MIYIYYVKIIIGDSMIESLKNTFKETLIAVAPICFLVVLASLIFKVDTLTIDSFLLSAFLLIIGITLFTFGADIEFEK